MKCGIGNKLHLCVGCRGPRLKNVPEMTCGFATSGFRIGNTQHRPDLASLAVMSRISRQVSLSNRGCPREEAHVFQPRHTVRAVRERELSWGADDTALVMLERMRVIDMAHNWAIGTH
jgi:hypothetical protein